MKYLLLIMSIVFFAIGFKPICDSIKELKNNKNAEMELVNDYENQDKLDNFQESFDRLETKGRILQHVSLFSLVFIVSGVLSFLVFIWSLVKR